MNNIILILATGAVVSIAETAYMRHVGIGKKEYKSLMKFAKKNKNIGEYSDIFEKLLLDRDETEKKLEKLEKGSFSYVSNTDIEKLKNILNGSRSEISALKEELEELKTLKGNADKNNDVKVLIEKTGLLENENIVKKQQISALEKEIAELKNDFSKKLEALEKSYNKPIPPLPPTPPEIQLNEDYINKLKESLKELKEILLPRDYKKMKAVLDNILEDDDYDDTDDLMSVIHSAIDEFIYKSFTKVKPEEIQYLRKFIISAGYEVVDVKSGYIFKDYAVYFSKPFKIGTEDDSLKGTIKQIDIEPYALTFNGEEYKLRGDCIFFDR